MKLEIEKLLAWSQAKQVNTRNGQRMLRKAQPTHEFWAVWKREKQALKDAGVSVTRDDKTGEFTACWWLPLDASVVSAIEASKAVSADVALPVPDGLDYLPYQKAGISLMRTRACNLLADEMGLGKTIQGIGLINCDPSAKKVLVVCPASLKINW